MGVKQVVILLLIFLSVTDTYGKRFDRGIENKVFVPKGQWLFGGAMSYSESENSNYKFIVLNHLDGTGYSFKVSPFVGYFFRDNVSAGIRLAYARNFDKLDNAKIEFGDDINVEIKDIQRLEHIFYTTGFIRTYINLGNSRRFGLFNEARLTAGAGEGKQISGKNEEKTGTFEEILHLQVGMSPGLVAFVSDNVAVEVAIGVLGFDFKWIEQTTNQVYKGERRKSAGNFKIDLFSLSLGLAFYL